MGIHRLILPLLLVTCVLVGRTHGFGTGAPSAQCTAMTPGHGQKEQTGKTPFTITTSSTTYTPNVPVQVTITGAVYKGFLLEARETDNSLVGTFSNAPAGTKVVKCTNDNDAVTHANKDPKSNLKITWNPPASDVGAVTFQATVVIDFATVWRNNKSPALSFKAAAATSTGTPPPSTMGATAGGSIKASDITADTCTATSDCTKKYNNVVCATTTPAADGTVTKKCACTSYFGFNLVNGQCIKQVKKIGDLCDPTKQAICAVANSACVDSGMNSNYKMCMCNANFVSVNVNGTSTCATVIGSLQDPTCAPCEKNNGICYTLTTQKKEGCKCIISQSGPNCETKLVNVKCVMKDMTMRICFTPHAGLNFSMPSTSLRVSNTQAASCRSIPADGTTCPVGQQQLVLSLNASDLNTCRISATPIGENFRYEANIVVSSNQFTAAYSVYCNYLKSAYVGAVSSTKLKPQNDQGKDLTPNITLTVLNDFLDPIGVILTGSTIYLRMTLYKNDTYGAATLQDCTISGKQKDKLCPGCSRRIIAGGCPNKEDSYVPPNSIKYDSSDATKLEITVGPLSAFKFPEYNLLYVHCQVNLCLIQETAKCPVPTCTAATTPAGTGGSTAGAATAGATTAGGGTATTGTGGTGTTAPVAGRRRKRDVDDRPNYITSNGYYVYDPQELNDKVVISLATFAGVLALLLALIIILTVVAIVLCCRMKKRNDKVADFEPKTPVGNHFALPRINRNNMRI